MFNKLVIQCWFNYIIAVGLKTTCIRLAVPISVTPDTGGCNCVTYCRLIMQVRLDDATYHAFTFMCLDVSRCHVFKVAVL